MKYLLLAGILFFKTSLHSQTLTEINLSYRIAELNGHVSGQFTGIASSSDGSTVFVASQAGGIFRSTDGGENFIYLKNFPSGGTKCIRYIERTVPVLIAAVDDVWLASGRRSLVWYSTDRGDTWFNSSIGRAPARYIVSSAAGKKGYDIDYNVAADIIYLATDNGLLQSTNGGTSFLYREDPLSMPASYKSDPAINSVKCGSGNNVYMAGTSGFYHSADAGINWTRHNFPSTSIPSHIYTKNSIDAVPGTNVILFVMSKYPTAASNFLAEFLFWSDNNGSSWTSLTTTPTGDGGCGGQPYIRTKRKSTAGMADSCVIYLSNRCKFFRKAFRITTSNTVDFSNSADWTALNNYHDDTHEIVFRNESSGQDDPMYMSTDGGLHKLRSGIDYRLISGPYRGLNALLVYDMTGQTIRHPNGQYSHTVYFGTQDNWLGYFLDGLRPYTGVPVIRWEGRGIETDLYGGSIAFAAGSPWGNNISRDHYTSVAPFINCPGNFLWPQYIKEGCYIQVGVPPGSEPGTVALYLSKNNGRNWYMIFSKTGEQPRMPKVVRTSYTSAIVYMPVHDASGNWVLSKIVLDLPFLTVLGVDLLPPFSYPVMPSFNGFGSLGFSQWEIPVFGINPANPEQLIAPDMISNTIKQSIDGGNNWTEIPGLTRSILGEGQYNFGFDKGSFITSVGFSATGQVIVIGTSMNGVFYSKDRGLSWAKVTGSGSLKNIYQPYFKPAISSRENIQEIFLPTHGRGIWKLEIPLTQLIPRINFPYWKYSYRQPGDIGLIPSATVLNPPVNQGLVYDELIIFDPDAIRSLSNTPNGISISLEEDAALYNAENGFIPLNTLDIPGLTYMKKGMKATYQPGNNNSGEKISGIAVYKKKIIALITSHEKAPFFATAKEISVELAKKNPPYNEKKLNQFMNRFLVTEVNTGQGKSWQLLCCNTDTRNGTRKDFTIWLDDRPFSSFSINKAGGCTAVPIATRGLPPGRYKLDIKAKDETMGTVYFEVRPEDKK